MSAAYRLFWVAALLQVATSLNCKKDEYINQELECTKCVPCGPLSYEVRPCGHYSDIECAPCGLFRHAKYYTNADYRVKCGNGAFQRAIEQKLLGKLDVEPAPEEEVSSFEQIVDDILEEKQAKDESSAEVDAQVMPGEVEFVSFNDVENELKRAFPMSDADDDYIDEDEDEEPEEDEEEGEATDLGETPNEEKQPLIDFEEFGNEKMSVNVMGILRRRRPGVNAFPDRVVDPLFNWEEEERKTRLDGSKSGSTESDSEEEDAPNRPLFVGAIVRQIEPVELPVEERNNENAVLGKLVLKYAVALIELFIVLLGLFAICRMYGYQRRRTIRYSLDQLRSLSEEEREVIERAARLLQKQEVRVYDNKLCDMA